LYINSACAATSTMLVQLFYAWRVWLLSSRNWFVVALIVACTIAQQVAVIWTLVKWGTAHAPASSVNIADAASYTRFVGSFIADVTITASLLYYLRKRMGPPSQLRVDTVISRIVQTNAIPLIGQTIALVLFRLDLGLYFFIADLVLCKVYVFSLVMSLIARRLPSAMLDLPSGGGLSKRYRTTVSTAPVSTGIPMGPYPQPCGTEVHVNMHESVDRETNRETSSYSLNSQDGHRDDKKHHDLDVPLPCDSRDHDES